MSQSEDIAAIHSYFSRTGAKNAPATAAKNNWFEWHKKLSLWDKTFNPATLSEAQLRRINFNALNGDAEDSGAEVTEAERKEWLSRPVVNTTGMSPEEAAKAVWTPINTPAGKRPTTAAMLGTTIQRATIRQGSTGSDVSAWQGIVGVPADGKFGPKTKAATVAWQKAHGLTPDGVVGPKTWTAALAQTPQPDKNGPSIPDLVAQQVAAQEQARSGTSSGTAPAPPKPSAPKATPPKLATAPKVATGTGTGTGTAPAPRKAPPLKPVTTAAALTTPTLPGWVKWTGLGAVAAIVASVTALVARRK